jgi:hypothetical protein
MREGSADPFVALFGFGMLLKEPFRRTLIIYVHPGTDLSGHAQCYRPRDNFYRYIKVIVCSSACLKGKHSSQMRSHSGLRQDFGSSTFVSMRSISQNSGLDKRRFFQKKNLLFSFIINKRRFSVIKEDFWHSKKHTMMT